MSLRPAAAAPASAAPVGAPVCLGDGPSRLHLVLRAGQAADTGPSVKEMAEKAAEELALKTKVMRAMATNNLDPVKEQLGLKAGAGVAQIRSALEPWLDRLRKMIKNKSRQAKFDRVLRQLRRITIGAPAELPAGCNWEAYVADKCGKLTPEQEDLLYNKMSEQRDKENFIFSVFMYLVRIAFMLD